MTKTISLDASKRLQEYMPEKTDKCLCIHSDGYDIEDYNHYGPGDLKTLTLQEAIDILPYKVVFQKNPCELVIIKNKDSYGIQYQDYFTNSEGEYVQGKTLLQAVEKMLLHLLDNNLLK